MTADSYSARVGLIEQATGNNNNNWGTIFNTSFADLLDRALWGIDTHAITGGTLDLSAGTLPPAGPSPVAGATQSFTGVLTSSETVTFPAIQGKWTIFNNTTGAFSLLLKTSGMATPIQIPQGAFVDVICDGTTLYRMDRAEVGRTFFYAGTVNQIGALEMNGASLLRSDYPDLFTQIGTTYGSADGTHFNLPLLTDTARYIRSRSASFTLGTSQANQNAAHSHTITGAPSANLSMDAQGTHSHTANVSDPGHTHNYTAAGNTGSTGGGGAFGNAPVGATTSNSTTGISVSIVSAGLHTHNLSGSLSAGTLGTASSGGTEARPESVVMIACIKY